MGFRKRSALLGIATVMALALAAVPAYAGDEQIVETTSASGDLGATGSVEAGDGIAASARAAVDDVNKMETITFSEFSMGTAIGTQYQSRGIVFGGDSPFITSDGANPTSPVLSGTPRFQGAIVGDFVTKSGQPRTVNKLELDVGYIDTERSVHIVIYGADGDELLEVPLGANGIVHATISQTGMASFRVEAISDEPAGFAVDNVSRPGFSGGSELTLRR